MNDLFATFEDSGLLISLAVFVATVALVLLAGVLIVPALETRRRVTERLLAEGVSDRRSLEAQTQVTKAASRGPIDAYFRATQGETNNLNGLGAKLFRAGLHQPLAPLFYNLSRIAFVVIGFLGAYAGISAILPAQYPQIFAFGGAFVIALGCIVVPSIALDFLENSIKEKYRRGFPDFMDMMITCADAGLSLEAAIDRVTTELAGTHKALGIQLAIMTLQIRAGKPLRDALRELSDRMALPEARSLAVLFRQSEELGTSLTEALRVYSNEMRGQRILRAEEKANALPVKIVIPLGLCIFPVVLMIVILPVIIRMKGIMF